MKLMFLFSNTHWTKLFTPLEIIMSEISLKYIPIHIYNYEHSMGIMNMKKIIELHKLVKWLSEKKLEQ